MFPSHLNFTRLKRLVPIEQVLSHRGLLHKLRCRANTLVGPCPIHSGDNPTAFVVSRTKNLWRCFTACDAGGDVVELVRRLDNIDYPRVAYYLASLAGQNIPRETLPPPVCYPTKSFTPFTSRLRLNPCVDFLQKKAIRPQTASFFEVGLYPGKGFLQHCVAVRLHDTQAQPLGYAGRRLDTTQARQYGKWKFPSRLPKKQLLYNFHRLSSTRSNAVVVVECPWGVMRLHQLGIPAVALLGTHLSSRQRELLLDVPRLILLMDADNAGRKAASLIRQQLYAHPNLSVATLSDGLDPDDLSDLHLAEILRPFLPYPVRSPAND